jgi:hypothetical protein
MRRLTALVVVWFVVLGSIARASEPEDVHPGPLAAAAAREVHLMVQLTVPPTEPLRSPSLSASQPPTQQRRWIGRHPVKSGALIGAGAGLAWGVVFVYTDTFEQRDSSTVAHVSYAPATLVMGPLLGAGLGALVGLVVSKVR